MGAPGPPAEAEPDGCTGWNNGDCEGTPHCPPRCPRAFDDDGRPFLVRPMEPPDREPLLAMYDAVDERTFGLPPGRPAARERWLDHLREDGWNLVARQSGAVVGHLAAVPAEDAEPAFVVFVADGHRGRGVGTELVRQAVARGAAREHDALELRVARGNGRAITVYTTVGFEVVERTGGHLRMALSLAGEVAGLVRRPPAQRPSVPAGDTGPAETEPP